jgi:hypothetical protein
MNEQPAATCDRRICAPIEQFARRLNAECSLKLTVRGDGLVLRTRSHVLPKAAGATRGDGAYKLRIRANEIEVA